MKKKSSSSNTELSRRIQKNFADTLFSKLNCHFGTSTYLPDFPVGRENRLDRYYNKIPITTHLKTIRYGRPHRIDLNYNVCT